MPAKPMKCCGKNVKLTPINIIINWAISHLLLSVVPMIKGYQ